MWLKLHVWNFLWPFKHLTTLQLWTSAIDYSVLNTHVYQPLTNHVICCLQIAMYNHVQRASKLLVKQTEVIQ